METLIIQQSATVPAGTREYNNLERREIITEAYETYGGRIRAFIGTLVPIYEDVEDIFQDVFHQLTNSIDQIQSLERMSAWLYRVARNRVIDYRRKKKPIPESQLGRTNQEGEGISLEDLLPDLSQNPEGEYLSNWILTEIEAAMDELPAEQREVFIKHEIEGYSFREMADETGLSINTLLARKRYAVQRLRKQLAPILNDIDEKG